MMKSILFLLSLASFAFAEADKPNFVFILADDLGIMDMSVEGSTLHETPHIDSIANEGMRFTEGYSTCQVCSPSRASIMTGKYPVNHGITDYIGSAVGLAWKRNDKVLPPEYKRHLGHEETTLAEALLAGGSKPSSLANGIWVTKVHTPKTTAFKSTRAAIGEEALRVAFSPLIQTQNSLAALLANPYLFASPRKPRASSRKTKTSPSSPTFPSTPCTPPFKPHQHCGKNTGTRHSKTHTRGNAS